MIMKFDYLVLKYLIIINDKYISKQIKYPTESPHINYFEFKCLLTLQFNRFNLLFSDDIINFLSEIFILV